MQQAWQTGCLQTWKKWNSVSFPGFPEAINSLFYPSIKLKPDVTNHLGSHFGTVQTGVRWCRRFDRHCRLFTWSTWFHGSIPKFVSVSVCCFVMYTGVSQVFYTVTPSALWQNSQSILEIPWVFQNQLIPWDFQVFQTFQSCKHPEWTEIM